MKNSFICLFFLLFSQSSFGQVYAGKHIMRASLDSSSNDKNILFEYQTFHDEYQKGLGMFDYFTAYNCNFLYGASFIFQSSGKAIFRISNCKFYYKFYIDEFHSDSCSITGSVLNRGFAIYNSQVDNLFISDNSIRGNLSLVSDTLRGTNIIQGELNDTLDLRGTVLAPNATLDINYLFTNNRHKERIPIELSINDHRTLVEFVNINFKKFRLVFPRDTDFLYAKGIYPIILTELSSKKDSTDYKIVARDYRHFLYDHTVWGRSENWIADEWGNYGRNLSFMMYFTIFVMLFYSAINLPFYKTLSQEVYTLPNFVPVTNYVTRRQKILSNIYYSIVYTSIIFFSPLIKLENFRFELKRSFGLFWVVWIYSTGLVLLYYIVHYLLKAN